MGQRYIGKLFKFRARLTTTDPNKTPILSGFEFLVDVPDVFDRGSDTVIPNTGATVSFNRTFHSIPAVLVTIQEAEPGDDVVITAKSTTQFTVHIENSGTWVERTINWVAQGY